MFEIGQHVRIRMSITRNDLDRHGLPYYFKPGDKCVIHEIIFKRGGEIGRYRARRHDKKGVWIFKPSYLESMKMQCMFNKED